MNIITRRLAALSLVAATALLVTPATQADAKVDAGGWGRVPYGGNQRSCADVSCGVTGTVSGGTTIWLTCWKDGGWANGTNRWFWTVNYDTLKAGYMSASLIYPQPVVDHC
ncbi:hypothetical protein AB0P21_19750 [Kribbella sp. NPDC056861]|uniref:hypothetical protein n=1 Tax=Kribbella sp. NPDC056861 TaxID=3154857 RepID=UPI00344A1DE8